MRICYNDICVEKGFGWPLRGELILFLVRGTEFGELQYLVTLRLPRLEALALEEASSIGA
jgi:hypothetical protein